MDVTDCINASGSNIKARKNVWSGQEPEDQSEKIMTNIE
jgi:hypothetical protein